MARFLQRLLPPEADKLRSHLLLRGFAFRLRLYEALVPARFLGLPGDFSQFCHNYVRAN